MAFQNTGQRQLQEMQERVRKQQEDQRRRMEMAHWKKLRDDEERLRAERLRSGAAATGASPTSSPRGRGDLLSGQPGGRLVGPRVSPPAIGRPLDAGPEGHPILALLLLPVLLVLVALVGVGVGWVVEYGVNFGDTASIVAAAVFWIVGGLWALRWALATWRGD